VTAPSSSLAAEIQKWREMLKEISAEVELRVKEQDERNRPKLTVIQGGRDA
jgi:hypothetical protein